MQGVDDGWVVSNRFIGVQRDVEMIGYPFYLLFVFVTGKQARRFYRLAFVGQEVQAIVL